MRAPWLADVLRAAGLTVVEVPGWKGRGRELGGIDGVVIHDTVTTRSTSDQAAADLLRDGRPGLAGPLAQLGLDRAGRLWVIADGKGNHNGYGEWGNSSIGIEVFAAGGLSGQEEPQSELQQAIGARAAAAILHQVGLPPSRCKGHKETDPGRKIDPYRVDMDHYRRRVAGSAQGDDELMGKADDIIANQWREAIETAKARDDEAKRDWKTRRVLADLIEAGGVDPSRLSPETTAYLSSIGSDAEPGPVHEKRARAAAEKAGVEVPAA